MKMLKYTVMIGVVLSLIVVGAIVGFMPRGVSADVESHDWLNTTYEGWDDFFDTNVVAYQAGSDATLIARVFNDRGAEISIDYGRLEVDWSGTAIEDPHKPTTIGAGKWALFTFNLDIPDTNTASNLMLHTYKITVQYDMPDNPDRQWTEGGFNLAVYSEEQALCRDAINKWDANNAYSFWGYEGLQDMTEAWYLYDKAGSEYGSGDFGKARTDYEEAVNKQKEAIEKDSAAALTGESALTLEGTGGIKGTGYLIAGIGILVLGVAVGLGILAWAFMKR